jgi:glycosyltransferase involved in cell wall biosynthesis
MRPEVSIGMPVYNGARFLRSTLDSLLQQTFGDFELIISDNASTDGTQAICEEYAQRDARIRYVRQPQNMGAVFNWNFVAQEASGLFFKWASANDRCDDQLLEKCVAELRGNSAVTLVYSRTALINDNDDVLSDYLRDPEILDASPSDRFIRARESLEMNNAQSGLIRLDVLRRTRGERGYPAGDMVLMAELALYGGFKLLPERLFYRRVDRRSTARYLTGPELRKFLRPQGGGMKLPTWRKYGDYAWSVLRSPIGMREKARALLAVMRWTVWVRRELLTELRALLAPRRSA